MFEIIERDVDLNGQHMKILTPNGNVYDADSTIIFRLTLHVALGYIQDFPGMCFCVDLTKISAMTLETAEILGGFIKATKKCGSETLLAGIPNRALSQNSPLAALIIMEYCIEPGFGYFPDETRAIESIARR